ncbi:cytochrome-c peroxidase [Candidatus Methylocalor cossyra]|uniref:Cytochrome c551 peroxidase n=1 Tax=Candidatus Methylocalor cossyra TaxID=3108543 RepID=A0ABP1CAV6_9GAMM
MAKHSVVANRDRHRRRARAMAWAAALGAFAAHSQEADKALLEKARQHFQPLPKDMGTEAHPTLPARVALGRKLFFDPRLSLDGTVSCATCHRPGLYGTDALPRSVGVERRPNARNAPTVLNAALHFKAHWGGERADVEEQALKSLTGAASFGNPDAATVIRKLQALGYEAEFKQAFPQDPQPVKPEHWGEAIGAYERTLVTPAPFDAYLEGNVQALSPQARSGLKAFLDLGCATCHAGAALGGTSFQKFGVFEEYWKATGSAAIDEGRFKETQHPADKYHFKVPGLRNVAMTPPYFHDGSVATLPQAVRVMAKVQLGKDLGDREVDDLVAFLHSLTGPLPADFAAEPVLPARAFSPTPP